MGAGRHHRTQTKGAGGLTVTLERRKLKHCPSTSSVKWIYLFLQYVPLPSSVTKPWLESIYMVSWNKPHCSRHDHVIQCEGQHYVSTQINPWTNMDFFFFLPFSRCSRHSGARQRWSLANHLGQKGTICSNNYWVCFFL